MNWDNIGANEIIAIVMVVFTILGFLKKMVNLFFTVISLGAGALAGIWGYNNGFSIAKNFTETPAPWMPKVVAAVAFIGAFVLIRKILKFITGQSREGTQTNSLGFGIPGSLMGLILGGGISYGLLSGVRYGGTLSELDHLKEYVNGKIESTEDMPMLAQVKNWIDQSKIGQWHQKIDFFNDPAETQLAKLAIIKQGTTDAAKAVIVHENDIPMALPVDEDTEKIINQGDFSALLKKAKELGVDMDVEKLLRMNIEKALGLQE